MRELHVVALSEDGRSVVLATSATASKGSYRVRLDGPLTAAVRGELRRPGEPEQPEVDLTPKDIQSRLRAGETPEQIASSAGVPVSRVERFEGPVVSERQRVIEQTRDAHLVRGRKGASALPLGVVVDHHLAEASSLVDDSVDWSARRLEDGRWEVALRYVSRARTRTARWYYDPVRRTAVGADPASAAMAHSDSDVFPVAKPVPRPPAKPVGQKKAASKPAGPRPKAAPTGTARKVTKTTTKAPAKAPAKKAVATPVAKKAALPKSAPAPVAKKPAPQKTAPKKTAPSPAPPRTRRAAAPPAPQPPAAPRRVLRIVTDDPLETEAAVVPRRAAGSRASVPAWADVLLGATPNAEPTRTRDDD